MSVSRAAPAPDDAPPAVLVVDDVEANLIALEALLRDLPCEVVLARSGNAALRQLLKREFALMLLDVQMPEMDGYEVARHAHDNPSTRDVPILFVTATHDTQDNLLRGYGSGAVDFLFKPIDSAILRSKVRVFLDLYNGRRQIADAKRALELTNQELSRAYGDLKTTQVKLVQAAKMASLGELVAGIAHEINNPLAFALSHLDTVKKSLAHVESELRPAASETCRPQWERAGARLTEMTVGLQRIRELVVKLRTFSRLDADERARASVKECVESVLMILQHRFGDRVRVETSFGEPDRIECYPGLLNQALMNLIANSIDAIEGPGTISVTTGSSGDRYAIVVSDSGSGIPAKLKDRIFEPFFTTKTVGKGTGLGLSITYSIVQRHGGTLEVTDREGGGTVISMLLPLAARPREDHGTG